MLNQKEKEHSILCNMAGLNRGKKIWKISKAAQWLYIQQEISKFYNDLYILQEQENNSDFCFTFYIDIKHQTFQVGPILPPAN